ncbi:PEGA domain-containing protein [Magnetococcales bacterium HHB-1]
MIIRLILPTLIVLLLPISGWSSLLQWQDIRSQDVFSGWVWNPVERHIDQWIVNQDDLGKKQKQERWQRFRILYLGQFPQDLQQKSPHGYPLWRNLFLPKKQIGGIWEETLPWQQQITHKEIHRLLKRPFDDGTENSQTIQKKTQQKGEHWQWNPFSPSQIDQLVTERALTTKIAPSPPQPIIVAPGGEILQDRYNNHIGKPRLKVFSHPIAAEVKIQDIPVGKTPIALVFDREGMIKIQLSKEGFSHTERKIWLSNRKTILFQRELIHKNQTELGRLHIRTTPSGASWYLNDKSAGETPTTLAKMIPGVYQLTIKKEGYQTWKRVIQISEGKPVYIRATLQQGKP